MPKSISLEPKQSGDQWILNLPPAISATGKRQRRFFSSRKAANEFAAELEKQQKTGIEVARRANPDLIRVAVDLDELFRDVYGFPGGLKEAGDEFMRRLDREGALPGFHDLAQGFWRAHERDWAAGTRGKQEWFRHYWCDLTVPVGKLLDVEFWSDWLNGVALKEQWADETFNNCCVMLSSVFEHAVKQGAIGRNPIRGVKRRKIRARSRAVFSVDQVRLLMECAWEHDRELVPYFALVVFAGLRPEERHSEIAKFVWDDVNWDEGWIKVASSKTETRRFVKLEPNLRAWLEPFRGRRGRIIVVNQVKRRRKLVSGGYQAPPGSPPEKWTPLVPWGHDVRDITRHTYGSYLDAKYRDYRVICENMGHTSIRTYQQYYRNTRTRQEGEAFWAIMPPA